MKIDKSQLSFARITAVLRHYQYLLVGLIIVGLFVYAVGIINSQLSPARDQAAYDAALAEIKPVKFDKTAVETIVRLRDLNIDVNAIFDPGRTNPFE